MIHSLSLQQCTTIASSLHRDINARPRYAIDDGLVAFVNAGYSNISSVFKAPLKVPCTWFYYNTLRDFENLGWAVSLPWLDTLSQSKHTVITLVHQVEEKIVSQSSNSKFTQAPSSLAALDTLRKENIFQPTVTYMVAASTIEMLLSPNPLIQPFELCGFEFWCTQLASDQRIFYYYWRAWTGAGNLEVQYLRLKLYEKRKDLK